MLIAEWRACTLIKSSYVITVAFATPSITHISVLPTTAMIILSWGKANPENICFAVSAVCGWYNKSFPLQFSCIAKHNKWLISWRKREHVTIRAWERSRAGTSTWSSSDSSHGNKGFGSSGLLFPAILYYLAWLIIHTRFVSLLPLNKKVLGLTPCLGPFWVVERFHKGMGSA